MVRRWWIVAGVAFVLALCMQPAVPAGAAAAKNLIFTSQIGFSPLDKKFATMAVPGKTRVIGSFSVVDDSSGKVVFEGKAQGPNRGWIASNKVGDTYNLDFSKLQQPGRYRVVSNAISSYPFSIDASVYDIRAHHPLELFRVEDASGSVSWKALDGFAGRRDPGHADDARPGTKKDDGGGDTSLIEQPLPAGLPAHFDVTGGWFDAGDYNKYMGNTPWAAYNLLLAYEDSPAYWSIDEDGNGHPDILEAATVGLDWMGKMVWKDGSVFERVFNGYNATFDGHPEGETDGTAGTKDDRPLDTDRYADITAKSSYAFALAGRIYEEPKYLDLARRTWDWAYRNQTVVKPQRYGGGLYFGDVENGLILGATELLRSGVKSVGDVDLMRYATEHVKSHLRLGDWVDPSSWDYQRSYALERYYELPGADANTRQEILRQMETTYRGRVAHQGTNAYGVEEEWFFNSKRGAGFGQNDLATSSALDALWTYKHSQAADRDHFRTYAMNEIQWVWGRNPFGESWLLSNRATDYTSRVHFRASAWHPLSGVVVPGATDRDENGQPDYADDGSFYYSEPTINQQALYIRTVSLMNIVTTAGGDK